MLPYLHEFVEKLVSRNLVSKIILFGSLAKGMARRDSDIDVLIISNSKAEVRKICEEVNEKIRRDGFENQIEPHVMREREMPREHLADAIQLFGQPVHVSTRKAGLTRKFIVCYDTSGMGGAARGRLFRALYGYRTRSERKGKVYESEIDGMIKKPGVEKIGTSTLLVVPQLLDDVLSIIRGTGGKTKVLEIWV